MGWTEIADVMATRVAELEAFSNEIEAEGFRDVVICGMGGSSLCSLVLQQVRQGDSPFNLHVLDSTNATFIEQLTAKLDLDRSLFIVASKSGSTVEPKAFEEYFYNLVRQKRGDAAGRQFVAITDPGSPMEAESKARGYRKIFLNFPDIGGRYSVLSYFGLVTAALLGYDLTALLSSARRISPATANTVAGSDAFSLGATLADHAKAGRDKITFLTSKSLDSFGLWAEQLIAESTGKHDKGVLPIAEEPIVPAEYYGEDRVFVSLQFGEESVPTDKVKAANLPLIERRIGSESDLGGEFLSWEIATATIGAVLEINPFDQPNVQAAKDLAKAMLKQVEDTGNLDEGEASSETEEWRIFGHGSVSNFLSAAGNGDYIAILAFVAETPEVLAAMQRLRLTILERTRCATTFGFGPRYLHSTGQFHKGGPKNGHFLVITDLDSPKIATGLGFDFATLCRAQAIGDCQALSEAGQQVLRLDLKTPITASSIDLIRHQIGAVSNR